MCIQKKAAQTSPLGGLTILTKAMKIMCHKFKNFTSYFAGILFLLVLAHAILTSIPSGKMQVSARFSLDAIAALELGDDMKHVEEVLGKALYFKQEKNRKYYVFAKSNWGKYIPFNKQFHALVVANAQGKVRSVSVKIYYPLIDGYIYVLDESSSLPRDYYKKF